VKQIDHNPYRSPRTKTVAISLRSKPNFFAQFTTAIGFFILHFAAIVQFAKTHGPIAGTGADAGSMIWLTWVWVDFPLGLAALYVSSTASTNIGALSWLVVIGGLQWAVWGWLLQKTISYIRR
jgi:hypothetical protein